MLLVISLISLLASTIYCSHCQRACLCHNIFACAIDTYIVSSSSCDLQLTCLCHKFLKPPFTNSCLYSLACFANKFVCVATLLFMQCVIPFLCIIHRLIHTCNHSLLPLINRVYHFLDACTVGKHALHLYIPAHDVVLLACAITHTSAVSQFLCPIILLLVPWTIVLVCLRLCSYC